jgi:hypothetical protein
MACAIGPCGAHVRTSFVGMYVAGEGTPSTPSPIPRRLKKAPTRATLSPKGARARSLDDCSTFIPLLLAVLFLSDAEGAPRKNSSGPPAG